MWLCRPMLISSISRALLGPTIISPANLRGLARGIAQGWCGAGGGVGVWEGVEVVWRLSQIVLVHA